MTTYTTDMILCDDVITIINGYKEDIEYTVQELLERVWCQFHMVKVEINGYEADMRNVLEDMYEEWTELDNEDPDDLPQEYLDAEREFNEERDNIEELKLDVYCAKNNLTRIVNAQRLPDRVEMVDIIDNLKKCIDTLNNIRKDICDGGYGPWYTNVFFDPKLQNDIDYMYN